MILHISKRAKLYGSISTNFVKLGVILNLNWDLGWVKASLLELELRIGKGEFQIYIGAKASVAGNFFRYFFLFIFEETNF